MSSKLLLVEPSATMRYVLENYAQSMGYSVVAVGDYKQAEDALQAQFQSYSSDFAGVLLGWPVVGNAESESLVSTLEKSDFSDLPVVVMSTDMRADTRAWVAGRDHTAVLSWKDYQALDDKLQLLLHAPTDDQTSAPAKFDNTDVHVLIVDDSASIRFALRDLFELQGYRVSVASGHSEAMASARQIQFDIAILDYYLQDGTGDVLCRDLIAEQATGNLVCAVLTGTYSDHIIKRSLRAGAVECMFKNESSELLLARVDALSRFVRQRKQLADERLRLDNIVDTLAGATLLINRDDVISYVSQEASLVLGFESRDALLGQNASTVLDVQQLRAKGEGRHNAQWRDASQGLVNVAYQQVLMEQDSDIVLNFKFMPGAAIQALPTVGSAKAASIIDNIRLPESSQSFVSTLVDYCSKPDAENDLVSLLIVDVFIATGDGEAKQADRHPDAIFAIGDALQNVYKRENHVAKLGPNRFGFLLRHTAEPQAYLLTRKIMQICNGIALPEANMQISSTGCLYSVSNNKQKSAGQIIDMTVKGLDVVNSRGGNQALLLDLRRMLPVYAAAK